MINNNDFSDIINKHRVLDNQSNKISRIFFDKLVSDIKIDLETKDYIKYGYILISVKNPNNVQIYYNDFLIAKINSTNNYIIPCAFEENCYLQVKGTSEDFNLVIYGANIVNKNKICIYPTQNYISKNRGKVSILSYTSINDIENNNLIDVMSIDNCLDFECVKISQNEYCAYLTNENDILYLYTNMDNYTTGIEIASGVKEAKILSDTSHSKIVVVYMKDNCVYYKTVSADMTLSSEGNVSFSNNYIPKSFSQILLSSYASPTILGIDFYGDTMEVFYFNGLSFNSIMTRSSSFSKIFVNGNDVEIYTLSDYKVNICKYTYDISSNVLSQNGASYNIWNANDIVKVGDVYLVYNDGVCSEVTYDSE